MATKWKVYARNPAKSPFDEYFLEQFDDLISMIKIIPPQKKYHAMPRLAVHGDYHPGNLKFKDGKVTGVFDFGWSKIDARCFDVGLAILYFCYFLGDGIRTEFCSLIDWKAFWELIKKQAKKIKAIGPLNQLELEYLPHMIHLGNLIVS